MRVSDKAIVLQTVRHGDKKYILKIYTRNHGILTVAARVGSSSNSKIKSNTVLPLSLLDVELVVKQNKEVNQLNEAVCYSVNATISSSLTKLSIAQFLNEVLIKTLKEQSTNVHLYDFIETCINYLNDSDQCINLHLYFMSELTKYLGIEPQNNFNKHYPYFDCREGKFTAVGLTMPLGLNENDSLLFSEFLKINSLKVNISNLQRQTLLEIFLSYYKLHVPGFNEVKSLEVLREVISG